MYDVYSVFLKRCEEYFLCQYLPPDGVKSVGEHLLLERQLYLDSLPPEQRHERGLVFDYLMRRETCITGVNNLNDLDLMEIGSYTELPGGNISLPTGYTSILKPLTVNIPAEKILKEHSVSVELILLWEPCDETSEMTDRWYRKIYSFTKVTETLLLAWISGDEAKYMETLPFDTVLEKCTEILRQFLGDPCVPRAKRCIW
ncbi:hypothetical protein HAZT_HAZT011638 [Hyalella azteca]|uniref:Amine oxidase domain-containing protein n=1 Tax=Hyalella azteca TaxID=294128 RepID=A0A6A0H2W3_HYAAZ|nr:hypothetical protein HAZT_HAZT011638 [Hyalella azteca]